MTKSFYLTTPIYYVNDAPHIGHAYTTVAGDVLTRWHRQKGESVWFLTGTDEHGRKIQEAAEKAGKTPKQFVDELSVQFKEAWSSLNIQPNRFIRTTDPDHEKLVQDVLKKCYKNLDYGFFISIFVKNQPKRVNMLQKTQNINKNIFL